MDSRLHLLRKGGGSFGFVRRIYPGSGNAAVLLMGRMSQVAAGQLTDGENNRIFCEGKLDKRRKSEYLICSSRGVCGYQSRMQGVSLTRQQNKLKKTAK